MPGQVGAFRMGLRVWESRRIHQEASLPVYNDGPYTVAYPTMGRETFLGRKTENRPNCPVLSINHTIMQAMRLPLPELDTIRNNSEAAPEWRARNLPAAEAFLRARHSIFEERSSDDLRALRRGPRAEAALARTRLKISVGLAPRELMHASVDAQLAFEARPVKYD